MRLCKLSVLSTPQAKYFQHHQLSFPNQLGCWVNDFQFFAFFVNWFGLLGTFTRQIEELYPDGRTPWRYPNSGGLVGPLQARGVGHPWAVATCLRISSRKDKEKRWTELVLWVDIALQYATTTLFCSLGEWYEWFAKVVGSSHQPP